MNRGGQVDTFQRYIYIHGSPNSDVTGAPESHGCIRVKPQDMLHVFDFLQYGDRVDITP
jgi:lipoprotein-anchoring transpeptidase ErfK/SrfK